MAISGNHYGWRDLIQDLAASGLTKEAKELQELHDRVESAKMDFVVGCRGMLKKHLKTIEPRLRPCHKKQGDKLEVYTWLMV